MELRGLAPVTRSGYVNAVGGLVRHYGRSPDRIGREELQ
ncbi:MAG: hypothetical protein ACOC8E_06745 [Planctomycetota bacterium]